MLNRTRDDQILVLNVLQHCQKMTWSVSWFCSADAFLSAFSQPQNPDLFPYLAGVEAHFFPVLTVVLFGAVPTSLQQAAAHALLQNAHPIPSAVVQLTGAVAVAAAAAVVCCCPRGHGGC